MLFSFADFWIQQILLASTPCWNMGSRVLITFYVYYCLGLNVMQVCNMHWLYILEQKRFLHFYISLTLCQFIQDLYQIVASTFIIIMYITRSKRGMWIILLAMLIYVYYINGTAYRLRSDRLLNWPLQIV